MRFGVAADLWKLRDDRPHDAIRFRLAQARQQADTCPSLNHEQAAKVTFIAGEIFEGLHIRGVDGQFSANKPSQVSSRDQSSLRNGQLGFTALKPTGNECQNPGTASIRIENDLPT